MDTLHQFELIIVFALQSLGDWLKAPMLLLSFLGTEEFFMLAMPVFYWCIDAALGLRLGMMLLLSNGLNAFFKVLIHSPRPFWFDPGVRALSAETGFGIPSGHAQNSASVWGLAAAGLRRRWVSVVCLLMIFLIGVSRLYLGMHFLTDVLGGWLLGGITVWLFVKYDRPLSAWVRRLSLWQKLALAAATALLLWLLVAVPIFALSGWTLPADWIRTAEATGGVVPDPLKLDGAFTLSGTWLGLTCGLIWFEKRRGGLFDTRGDARQQLLRYLVGVLGIGLIWYGLGLLQPRNADLVSYLFRLLRYTLAGLWVTALAPFLFLRLRLAK